MHRYIIFIHNLYYYTFIPHNVWPCFPITNPVILFGNKTSLVIWKTELLWVNSYRAWALSKISKSSLRVALKIFLRIKQILNNKQYTLALLPRGSFWKQFSQHLDYSRHFPFLRLYQNSRVWRHTSPKCL